MSRLVLSILKKYTTGFHAKRCGKCCGSAMLTVACYWPSTHRNPAQKSLSVSQELNHNRSLWMLNDKGVCFHHTSSWSSISGLHNIRASGRMWPARASSIAENVVKARLRIINRPRQVCVVKFDQPSSFLGYAGLVNTNWIDSNRRVDEDVTVESCRINRLLFSRRLHAACIFWITYSHAFDRFAAACDQAEMKICAKMTEVLCLSGNPSQCVRCMEAAIHCSRLRRSGTLESGIHDQWKVKQDWYTDW